MAVKKATAADIEALIRLESALFAEDAGVHDPLADITWPEREGRDDFEQLINSPDCLVLVAWAGAEAVGFLAGYQADSSPTRQPVRYGVLRSLFVTPAARRTGAARQLCEEFIDWSRGGNCVEVTVDHYVANNSAGRLYESLGFTPQSLTRTFRL